MMSTLVITLVLGLVPQQLPPPNLVENGDARGGSTGWQRLPGAQRAAAQLEADTYVETRDGAPCFLVRNGASWTQHVPLHEEHEGKFLLIIARGSSQRVHPDGNITGLPYLWAHVVNEAPLSNHNVFQGMALRSTVAGEWRTMHGIFRMPSGGRSIKLKLGQAARKGTPQNGSAACVTDVEMRLFDTRAAAEAYVPLYTAAASR